jgi:hypothetical protein
VLLALRQCLQSEWLAEDSLREIVWQFYQQFTDNIEARRDNVDIDFQKLIASRYIDTVEQGWFAEFMIFLAKYLYSEALEKNEAPRLRTKEVARVGLILGKDAWALYASVMKIFGWNMNTTFLED